MRSPATDPHDYEPTPADAKVIAMAAVFVENGVGYDSWAARAVRADPEPGRQVIDVAQLTGTPAGGNPHRWYSPRTWQVADAITAALKRADPADAGYFDRQHEPFVGTGLAEYHRLIAEIRTRYAGTPVGASESVFSPLADALGLDLITPAGFLRAISEGADPSAADKAAIDAQLSGRQIEVYVFNSQNSTPDVAAQVRAAQRAGIPVVDVTETPTPAGARFQDWQVRQLQTWRPRWRSPMTARADERRRGPVVRLRDAAARIGGRTIWSGVSLTVRAASSSRCWARTAPASRPCSGRSWACSRPRRQGGGARPAGRPGQRGDRLPAAAAGVRRQRPDPGHRRGPAGLGR